MLGHDLEMACGKFQENRFRIDGEINEKHALLFYQNNCVLQSVSPDHGHGNSFVLIRSVAVYIFLA